MPHPEMRGEYREQSGKSSAGINNVLPVRVVVKIMVDSTENYATIFFAAVTRDMY